MINVPIEVYNNFTMVDSFYVEYDADLTLLQYINAVNRRKYYPYNMINVNDGIILIPLIENRCIVIKDNEIFVLDGEEVINLLEPNDGRD
jgi:hypothetical protein